MNANKHALKLIDKTTKDSKVHVSRKELLIPVGNHVYCMIIPKVGIRFKINISLTFTWLLVISRAKCLLYSAS